ncbi:adenosine deaminase [Alteromonas sp. C1M14]|uniref:adenosine deaminase family protein n=1 Tax=Alteromonas sp. C1M14 TaxID=2841567 RepID=UPI001C094624|nr:adenosine deaminase [Alteromonas sp. C1M14]MBU2978936.1 adenosine deaminase [Alteromonas sp. C1M14]
MAGWFRTFKQTASPQALYNFLHALPKGGDLHHHLTGSAFSEWWWALATDTKINGGYTYYTRTKLTLCDGLETDPYSPKAPFLLFRTIQASTFKALPACEQAGYVPLSDLSPSQKNSFLNSLRLDKDGEGRTVFFEQHWQRLNELTRNPYLTGQLLIKNMQAYAEEHVSYLETQVNVHHMLKPDGTAFSADDALNILRQAVNSQEGKDTGVTVKFQYAILRFLPNAEETLRQIYQFVDANRDIYVGINFVGREDNDKGHPLRFLSVLRELRHAYPKISLAIHAGEVDEPNEHVRNTLLLGADRIGHGINTITDPDTLLLMRHGPYLIEINLISNLLLEYVDSYQQHPFGEYLRLGIPVALSTDDRGMWDSTLTDEFYVAVTQFNLSWQELRLLAENAIAYSFLPPQQKQQQLTQLSAQLDKFEANAPNTDFAGPMPTLHQFICRFDAHLCGKNKTRN